MPRRPSYNQEGAIIMGAAGQHAHIFSVPELAEKTGIPYQTLHGYMKKQFCGDGFARFRAIVKATGMTDEEIVKVVRG